MSLASLDKKIAPGLKVSHAELGEGVVVGQEPTGFVSVFFRTEGERQVPADSLNLAKDRFDSIIGGFSPISSPSFLVTKRQSNIYNIYRALKSAWPYPKTLFSHV